MKIPKFNPDSGTRNGCKVIEDYVGNDRYIWFVDYDPKTGVCYTYAVTVWEYAHVQKRL